MASSARERRRLAGRFVGLMGLAVGLLAPVVGAVGIVTAGPASAAGPTVLGTGSSYAALALQQWQQQIANYGVDINYQSSSSVLGLNEYAQGQVNFAASEIGYSTGQAAYTPAAPYQPYQYLPDVAGAECLMYNLDTPSGTHINNLHLDAQVLMQMFDGEITQWNDPAIASLNPGLSLPATSITKVYRTDPSGDNYIFTDYFATLYPSDWNAFNAAMGTPDGAQAIYPQPSNGVGGQHGPYDISNFQGQSGSDNASEYVAGNPNSITYVETGYAITNHEPCAYIENPAGDFVQPSVTADAVALTQDQLEPDLEQILTGVFLNPNPVSYPISAYSYLITQENGQPAAPIGAALGEYIHYFACQGQTGAEAIGYSPIPPNLVADDFAAVNRLNGAATLPTPDASNCPNPYLTGALPLPGEPIQLSGGPTGTSGGGTSGGGTSGGGTSGGGTSGGGTSGGTSGGTTGSGSAGGSGARGTTATTPAGSSTILPNGVSVKAAVAAAAAKQSEVARALKKKAAQEAGKSPGAAELGATDALYRDPLPTREILAWSGVALALFVVVPLAVAWVSRRRLRSPGPPDPDGPIGGVPA